MMKEKPSCSIITKQFCFDIIFSMNILSVNNVKKIGRDETLFENVTFGLNEGEKAALIGRNGKGKSTLLNIIAGNIQLDDGKIAINNESGISFLPQNPFFNENETIREHIFKSSSPKLKTIEEYLEVCSKLGGKSDSIQKKYEELSKKMENHDLWNYESQVESILSTLGINNLEEKMGTLSGGMIKKVALASVLVEDTKLLLLDEPTNHLDISTIEYLQNYLRDTKRTVLMVTHDRYFLDAVCTTIFEIDNKRLKIYEGNYSKYLEKKETEIEIQKNTDRRIESILRFERDWLRRGPCARGTKAKARIQNDEKLINHEKFREEKGFKFEVQGKRLGGKVLVLNHISKNFPKANNSSKSQERIPVIRDFSYTFTKGERIGVFGGNGSGKSTFLNIITGTIKSDSGSVEKGENTSFGYYNQNPSFQNLEITVLDYIKEKCEFVTRKDGKTISASLFLNEFGFEGKIQHSPLSSLSGGERKRLFLVRLLMQNPNFLVLDEPTNDFDIFTMNVMEDFLLGYEGCLLIVSHDRYFLDKIADSLFILEDNGNISGFVGKCSEYLELQKENLKKIEDEKKRERKKLEAQEELDKENQTHSEKKKLSFKEQKEFESLESRIANFEKTKSSLEEKMTNGENGDFSNIEAISKEYQEVSKNLEEFYKRWEELASRI